jgi:curved DNA-binding protein CbpA
MAKIHTHYDNLKVARMAPQEVIRAAYKALSQKYHPDKNPGDEKAARIMAIINTAYGTLADPQRRREHDEWIAAEEWEIEWLESTRQEDGRGKHPVEAPGSAWEPEQPSVRAYLLRRDWKWWASLGACLVAGWVGGTLTTSKPDILPAALASVWGAPASAAKNDAERDSRGNTAGVREARGESSGDAVVDSWSTPRPAAPVPMAPIRVAAVSQVSVPGDALECISGANTQVAPNGEPWPSQTGYLQGFPVRNQGDDMHLTVDNAKNALPVFVTVYDLDRRANVRYGFILPHEKLAMERLSAGKYEVHYQNVDLSGTGKDGCATVAKPSGNGTL